MRGALPVVDTSHRDRIAFVRICSGRFTKGKEARHVRLGKTVRLKNPSAFMARERSTIEEAYAGDIIGLYDPGIFRIGDTLTTGKDVVFEGIPLFSPELFRRISVKDPLKRKQLLKGLTQLAEEGAIQVFADFTTEQLDIVGAVGQLQHGDQPMVVMTSPKATSAGRRWTRTAAASAAGRLSWRWRTGCGCLYSRGTSKPSPIMFHSWSAT